MDTILGINAQTFIDKGIWGVATLILIIIGKLWVIPSISKALENRLNMGTRLLDKLDVIITSLDDANRKQNEAISSFKQEINIAHNDRQKIEHKVDVLLGEHAGTLDDTLALNIFASTIHKQHLVALCFYNLRVASNGMETSRQTILARYGRKAEEVAGKTLGQLSHYYHDGQQLSHFFGDYSTIYFHQIFDDLFVAQETSYKNPGESYSLEDIEAALDRNVSRLMSAFRKWIRDKSHTCEKSSEELNYDLWQDIVDFDV